MSGNCIAFLNKLWIFLNLFLPASCFQIVPFRITFLHFFHHLYNFCCASHCYNVPETYFHNFSFLSGSLSFDLFFLLGVKSPQANFTGPGYKAIFFHIKMKKRKNKKSLRITPFVNFSLNYLTFLAIGIQSYLKYFVWGLSLWDNSQN